MHVVDRCSGDENQGDSGTRATAFVLCPTVTAAIGRAKKRDPFRVRADANEREAWSRLIKRADRDLDDASAVCDLHFESQLLRFIKRCYSRPTATNSALSIVPSFSSGIIKSPKKGGRYRIFVNSMLTERERNRKKSNISFPHTLASTYRVL